MQPSAPTSGKRACTHRPRRPPPHPTTTLRFCKVYSLLIGCNGSLIGCVSAAFFVHDASIRRKHNTSSPQRKSGGRRKKSKVSTPPSPPMNLSERSYSTLDGRAEETRCVATTPNAIYDVNAAFIARIPCLCLQTLVAHRGDAERAELCTGRKTVSTNVRCTVPSSS